MENQNNVNELTEYILKEIPEKALVHAELLLYRIRFKGYSDRSTLNEIKRLKAEKILYYDGELKAHTIIRRVTE